MRIRCTFIGILLLMLAGLTGCNFFGAGTETPVPTPAVEATPIPPTPTLNLAPTLPPDQGSISPPTLTPSPEGTPAEGENRAPTALPEPTQIDPGATQSAGTGPIIPVSGPGISIRPDLGEPGETIQVEGSGFDPNIKVTLHWGSIDGTTGPQATEVTTSSSGSFSLFIQVPPADQWPGGNPKELDYIQLRAKYNNDFFYFANYRYIVRFNPIVPVLPFSNTDYGYSITVLNGWTWSWDQDESNDVRFKSPSGGGFGFIQVFQNTSVNAVIPGVMAAEAAGQSYTTASAGVGAYPATQATAGNGLIVYFIPSGSTIYALAFVDDSGANLLSVAGTFRLN
jgi:hypothetical protein